MDHYTYVLASDGDLMEGVAEASSIAGTLRLGRLILLYDANLITLSATTNLTLTKERRRALRSLWLARAADSTAWIPRQWMLR